LEAIVNGVPMVAIPHWADQPTISKYMESMWGLGVRVRKDEKGLVTRDEVERCIKDVMDGDSKDKYRKSATMWMQKAKAAMQNGGSSDKNITEFIAKYSLS
jgi:UDP:flavonoid glycosyltransferase YjiC (YdhE family)